jgi:cell division protein FtsB
MDNLFYRKDTSRSRLKTAFKRLLGNRRALALVVIGLPLVLYLLFGSHGVIRRAQLTSEKQELEQKIRNAEEETRSLQAQSKSLDGDKKAIEKVAREKYGMIREGETVYKVKKEH